MKTASATATGLLPACAHWAQSMALRGLRTLGIGFGVAVVLTALSGGAFVTNFVYAECISIACWFFIDCSRMLVAKVKFRATPTATEQARNLWPGWGWMAVCLLLGTLAGIYSGGALGDWLTGQHWGGSQERNDLRRLTATLAFSLIPSIGISFYYHTRQRLRSAEANAESARRHAAEHQLRLLESQLEPHMLFNTLANLRVLIALDPARAQAMLDQLIAFLRATLGASRVAAHPLAAEFGRLGDYLALMQVRMGERLQVRFDLPVGLASASVPPLLLQPLVENCIKHALEPNVDGGRIDISAARDGDALLLRVRDTGCGLPAAANAAGSAVDPSSRFGLQQVRERLATLYGGAAWLTLAPVEGDAEGGTLATVRLPFRLSGSLAE